MSASTVEAPPQGDRILPRVALAVALAGVGFLLVWRGLGVYSLDLHPTRVIAAAGALLVGGLVAAVPARLRPFDRALIGACALFLAVAAWLYVPAPRGLSLRQAIHDQAAIAEELDGGPDARAEPGDVLDLQARIEALAADYPGLGEPLARRAREWGGRAAADLARRFDELPPDKVATAVALQTRAGELATVFPETRRVFAGKAEAWAERAADRLVEKLDAVPGRDVNRYEADAARRAVLADAFPVTRDRLARAEAAWADRLAASATSALNVQAFPAMTECLWARNVLVEIPSLDRSEKRFAAARTAVFALAHEAAVTEVLRLVRTNQFDAAAGLAAGHAAEWLAEAAVANREEAVVRLRDGSKYLAVLSAKAAGDPDALAPPRARESLPAPREKGAGEDDPAAGLIDRLNAVAGLDVAGYKAEAERRAALAAAVPATRDRLIKAEAAWADRLAASATSPLNVRTFPETTQIECEWALDVLRGVPSIDRSEARFATARATLFGLAFESARLEVVRLIQTNQFDAAAAFARAHAEEWLTEAAAAGRAESVERLRDWSKYLAARTARAAPAPDALAVPRPRDK